MSESGNRIEKLWFVPNASRERVSQLMQNGEDGSYIVSNSSTRAGRFTLFVKLRGRVTRVRVESDEQGQWFIGSGRTFDSVSALIRNYRREPLSLHFSQLNTVLLRGRGTLDHIPGMPSQERRSSRRSSRRRRDGHAQSSRETSPAGSGKRMKGRHHSRRSTAASNPRRDAASSEEQTWRAAIQRFADATESPIPASSHTGLDQDEDVDARFCPLKDNPYDVRTLTSADKRAEDGNDASDNDDGSVDASERSDAQRTRPFLRSDII